MAARVTLKQVAARAGVSLTTVSLVLNDAPGTTIGAATRERVLAVARELGYVPSAAARTLVSGRSQTVGLVICHAEHLVVDAYIPQVLFGANQVARSRGLRVLVEAVEDVTRPDAYLELVRAKQIDGLLVLNPRSDDVRLPQLVRDGFPVVVLGTVQGPEDAAMVFTAEAEHSREAVEHLLRLGHRRIGHVTFAPATYHATDARARGYREALERAGVEIDARDTVEGHFSAASGAAATQALLARRPDLTAVFCGNDTIALGALAALADLGRRVPQDVAVVGYDDIPTARFFVPALTTIAAPAVEHGRRAMELLVDLVDGRAPAERRVRLDARLVVRRSCGAPESWRTPPEDDGATMRVPEAEGTPTAD